MSPKQRPLGVMPEWRWRELRVRDLVLAFNRYAEEGLVDTPENHELVGGWIVEANGHLQWLMDHPERCQQQRLDQ